MTIPEIPAPDALADLAGTSPWRAASASPGTEPSHVVDRNDDKEGHR